MTDELEFEFPVSKVLERVEANREQHQKDYEDAVKGYWIELAQQLEKVATSVAGAIDKALNRVPLSHYNFHTNLTKPEHHLGDYDRVIDMLKMTIEAGTQTVKLNESQYRRYVRDEWDWKQQFTMSNMDYHSHVR